MATKRIKLNHMREIREATRQLLDGVNRLRALNTEWNALALGAAYVDPVDATPDNPTDFLLDFDGLTTSDLAGVYTSLAAIDALLAQGHSTNLHKLD